MANRFYVQQQYTLIKGLVYLFPTVKMTASTTVPVLQKRTYTQGGANSTTFATSFSAAPTSGPAGSPYAVGDAAGTRSVSRTGTGAWTLTLSDAYSFLVGITLANFASATGASSTIVGVTVVSGTTNVTTNTAQGNGGVLTILLVNSSGAAVDPVTIGDTFTFQITLGNATEP